MRNVAHRKIVLRRSRLRFATMVLAGTMLAGVGPLVATTHAQTANGSIRGSVTDSRSGIALAGARVTVMERGSVHVTDRTGDFRIDNLPPGDYTLQVEYLGLRPLTSRLSVTAASTTRAELIMGDEAGGDAAEIVVTGRVTDTTRRLNQERAADALTEIAAPSTAAEYPDRNLGEVLQRLTGIFIDRNGTGEGNVLLIRAINSANNLLLVEGVRLPSGRPDGRTPNLATINSDVIGNVEARKVFTPEIPGDFFGGYVNVRQNSAFDRSGTFVAGTLQAGYRSIETAGADFEFAGRASTRLANDTFGIALSGGIDKRDATFHQYNAARSPNNTTGALTAAATLPTSFQYRQVAGEIERYSLNLSADYRPDDQNNLYLRAFYNYGKETIDDRRINVFFGPAPIAGSDAVTGGYPGVIPELETIPTQRPERFINLVAGGDHAIDDWGVSYMVGFNRIDADQNDAIRFAARSPTARPVAAQYDFSDPEQPLLTLANPAVLTTLSTYGPSVSVSTNLAETDEEQFITQLSLSRRVDLGSSELELRMGGRYDRRKRASNIGGLQNYPAIPLTAELVKQGDSGLFRNQFDLPNILDSAALLDGFTTPSIDRPIGDPNYFASIAADFSGTEQIMAIYGMGTLTAGSLRVIGGLRYETTDVKGTNITIDRTRLVPNDPDPLDDDRSDGVYFRSLSSGYAKWLPALVVRYEPTDRLLLRAAATRTYARPTIAQLLGGETVNLSATNPADRSISRGNIDLVPQNAWNFDVSVDLYGRDANVLRLGGFYKKISNVFYTAAITETNTLGGTDFISQPQNGGNADVWGVEAGLIQRLSFLPGPLDRLSVELNAGFSWSEQEVLSPAGVVIRKTDLEGSYDFIGNASLVYRDDWGRMRVAYRRSGTRVNLIDTNPNGGFNDSFRAPSEGLDADISFNLNDRLSVAIEARNILKQVEVVEYIGTRNAVSRAQYSGWSIGGSISFRLF